MGWGTLAITLGTSTTVQLPIAEPSSDPSGVVQTFCHGLPGTWQLLAAVLSGGGSLDWYEGVVGRSKSAADMVAGGSVAAGGSMAAARACQLAATVPPGAEGLIFLPHLTGEAAPHLDPEARGAWFGLTRRHDHRHLARAVIEGVAFAARGVVEAIEALAGTAREIRLSGGGSQNRLWLEIFANVLGRRITVGAAHSSARGAALLAMAMATARDPLALAAEWAVAGTPIEPEPETAARYELHYAVFRELYPATRLLMHRLADLDRPPG
jgi:xylulokinase